MLQGNAFLFQNSIQVLRLSWNWIIDIRNVNRLNWNEDSLVLAAMREKFRDGVIAGSGGGAAVLSSGPIAISGTSYSCLVYVIIWAIIFFTFQLKNWQKLTSEPKVVDLTTEKLIKNFKKLNSFINSIKLIHLRVKQSRVATARGTRYEEAPPGGVQQKETQTQSGKRT